MNYSAVGICISFSVNKENYKLEEVETALSKKYYLPNYECREIDSVWKWELKEDLFNSSFTDFVLQQFELYGEAHLEGIEMLTTELLTCTNKQDFIDLAMSEDHYHFQWDNGGESEWASIVLGKHIDINYECIILFSEGKIKMEGWEDIFQYLSKQIGLANPDFPIAKAMKVYITEFRID